MIGSMFSKVIFFSRFALIAVLVVVFGRFVVATDQPHVRYSGYICQYRAMFDYEGVVDVAIFGSSRMQEAANAKFISKALVEQSGNKREYRVYDLSRSGRDHSHITQFAKDFVQNRNVRYLVIEIKSEDLGLVHPRYGETVPWARLLSDAKYPFEFGTAADRWGKLNFITSKSRGRLVKRFADYVQKGKNTFKKPRKRKNRDVVDCSPRLGTFADPKGLAQWNGKYKDWKNNPPVYWNINNPIQRRAMDYTQDIIDVARSHGTEPVFVYVPRSNEQILDTRLVKEFEEKFGVRFISFDLATSKKAYVKGYANRNHMGVAGQRIFANWFASVIEQE